MHAQNGRAHARAIAVPAPRDPQAGSAAPLLIGLAGYLALLPVAAFGACALALLV